MDVLYHNLMLVLKVEVFTKVFLNLKKIYVIIEVQDIVIKQILKVILKV